MSISEPIPATLADAAQIARIQVESTVTSPITITRTGTADLKAMTAWLAKIYAADIDRPFRHYLVIKDTESNDVISYVLWIEPRTDQQAAEEETAFQKTFVRPLSPEGTSREIGEEFMKKITAQKKRILGDPAKLHWYCGSLATDPAHQRQGAAAKLMQWPFAKADADELPVYLETNLDGPAISTYRKLGFFEIGDGIHIDLGKYGGQGVHTHIPMIRSPKTIEP